MPRSKSLKAGNFWWNAMKKPTLRDYDKNTIHEKLEQAYFDQRAYDNLWERAMNNNRIEYDRNRWSKTNKKPA